MVYEVIVTPMAYKDYEGHLDYILQKFKSRQAFLQLENDMISTMSRLEHIAGSLRYEMDEDLAALGYRRIHLAKHQYFLLYTIHENTVYVERMFHDLEDYRNHIGEKD